MSKTQTQVTKPATKGAQKPASKPATKPAIVQAVKGSIAIDKALHAFLKGIFGAYHKANGSIADDGRLSLTAAGRALFTARVANPDNAQAVADCKKAMADNVDLASGKAGSRAWRKNSAMMGGKAVAMPVCTGAGDKGQQAAIALLLLSSI